MLVGDCADSMSEPKTAGEVMTKVDQVSLSAVEVDGVMPELKVHRR